MNIQLPNRINFLGLSNTATTGKTTSVFVDTSLSETWLRSQTVTDYAGSWSPETHTLVKLRVWSVDPDYTTRIFLSEHNITGALLDVGDTLLRDPNKIRYVLLTVQVRRNSDNVLFDLPLICDQRIANFSGQLTFTTTFVFYDDSDSTGTRFLPVNGSGPKAGKTFPFINGRGVRLANVAGNIIITPDVAPLYTNPNESDALTVSAKYFDRQCILAEKEGDRRNIIRSSVFLKTTAMILPGNTVTITTNDGAIPVTAVKCDIDEYSDLIHTSHMGYHTNLVKQAMISGYAGTGNEVIISGLMTFELINLETGQVVFTGPLGWRRETKFRTTTWYQQVKVADFTAFTTPGYYCVKVARLGRSLPFVIDVGVTWAFARAFMKGMYNLRCGSQLVIPFTRQTHAACHQVCKVASPAESYPVIWSQFKGAKAPYQQVSAPLVDADLLYPFLRPGGSNIGAVGGHHDAGDYGRYSTSVSATIYWLALGVDHLRGHNIDNLGIPESSNGKPDLLDEAMIDAIPLLDWQESDGGFYSTLKSIVRSYEEGVSLQEGDEGDTYATFPKDIVSTNMNGAGLARLGRSPHLRTHYGDAIADTFIAAGAAAWEFTTQAFFRFSDKASSIQAMRGGWDMALDDDFAWLCVEMYLATGEEKYHLALLGDPSKEPGTDIVADTLTTGRPYDPSNIDAFVKWRWNRDTKDPGYMLATSYTFAELEGLRTLDATFLAKCKKAVTDWADYTLSGCEGSSFGDGLSPQYKINNDGQWVFSAAEAVGLAVGYELSSDSAKKARYVKAYFQCCAHMIGCNAVNQCFVMGCGYKPMRQPVSQWTAANHDRIMPPTGIITSDCCKVWYQNNLPSKDTVKNQFFPGDRPYFNRFVDSFEVVAELVVPQQAEAAVGSTWLAAVTTPELVSQVYRGIEGTIEGVVYYPEYGVPMPVKLTAPGVPDSVMRTARIIWEESYKQPELGGVETFFRDGHKHVVAPTSGGIQRVEAEAHLPDGRMVIGRTTYVYAAVPNQLISKTVQPGDPNILVRWDWNAGFGNNGGSFYVPNGLTFANHGGAFIDPYSWTGVSAVKFGWNEDSDIIVNLSKDLMKGPTGSPRNGILLDFVIYPRWNGQRNQIKVIDLYGAYNANLSVIDGNYWQTTTTGLPYTFNEFVARVPTDTWTNVQIEMKNGQTGMRVNGGNTQYYATNNYTNLGSSTLAFRGLGGWIGPLVIRAIP